MKDESEVVTISTNGQNLHGFYVNKIMKKSDDVKDPCILVALETSDNQIDLNTLHIKDNFDYTFK